jgi:HB1/ASXL restriction endonuclease-like protein with HTH domain
LACSFKPRLRFSRIPAEIAWRCSAQLGNCADPDGRRDRRAAAFFRHFQEQRIMATKKHPQTKTAPKKGKNTKQSAAVPDLPAPQTAPVEAAAPTALHQPPEQTAAVGPVPEAAAEKPDAAAELERLTPPESPSPEAQAAPTVTASLPVPAKKLSARDAAARVLAEAAHAMNCQEMIDTMAAKGYWTSPGGKTPAATLYSSILRELKIRGAEARFRKTQRGKFAANSQG